MFCAWLSLFMTQRTDWFSDVSAAAMAFIAFSIVAASSSSMSMRILSP